jgi:hypothetical protein
MNNAGATILRQLSLTAEQREMLIQVLGEAMSARSENCWNAGRLLSTETELPSLVEQIPQHRYSKLMTLVWVRARLKPMNSGKRITRRLARDERGERMPENKIDTPQGPFEGSRCLAGIYDWRPATIRRVNEDGSF